MRIPTKSVGSAPPAPPLAVNDRVKYVGEGQRDYGYGTVIRLDPKTVILHGEANIDHGYVAVLFDGARDARDHIEMPAYWCQRLTPEEDRAGTRPKYVSPFLSPVPPVPPGASHKPVWDVAVPGVQPSAAPNDFRLFAAPAVMPSQTRLDEALDIIEAESGAFLLVMRLGDKDPHEPGEERGYAIVTSGLTAREADVQTVLEVRRAVNKWLNDPESDGAER